MTFKIVLFGWLLATPLAVRADESYGTLVPIVLKGGRVFSEEEIKQVQQSDQIEDYQKAILITHMLSSAENPARLNAAIQTAREYIEKGDVKWAVDYLEMQEGFLTGLVGKRDSGAKILEKKLAENAFADFDKVDDPLVREMHKSQENLGSLFPDVMKQSLGSYYLDFAGDAKDPEKAIYFFNSIQMEGMKQNGLQEVQIRTGREMGSAEIEAIRAKFAAVMPVPGNEPSPEIKLSSGGERSAKLADKEAPAEGEVIQKAGKPPSGAPWGLVVGAGVFGIALGAAGMRLASKGAKVVRIAP